ncbi:MAG: host attachment protein [Nitrospirota bacterium]|nr:host attachment protein [Nitrospirota bacterium]
MAVTWVLVADSSRARIFSKKNGEPYAEVEGMIHPESRMHEQQLTSDLPGSDSGGGGAERHAYAQRTPPKRHEAMVFSKQVVERLEAARSERCFRDLMVVAPPSFLGMLRDEFSGGLSSMVKREINKNLVQMKTQDLLEHLPRRI